VAQSCYYPAARLFLKLVRLQGLRLAISFTLSFVHQAQRWEPALLDLFRELVAEDGVEIVGADPYHSVHCLIDLPAFAVRMRAMADDMEDIFGKRPAVTDTTAMGMSAGIYHALDAAGFRATFAEGSTRVLGWRSSNYLYRYNHEYSGTGGALMSPYTRWSSAQVRSEPGADSPSLMIRHQELSADVGLRFSDPAWSGYPLYADVYARWIAQAQGDVILLGWDCETFGGRHPDSSGIFEFLQALPGELRRHGVALRTPGELINSYPDEHVYHLPLPIEPIPFADAYGLDSITGSGAQRELFQLMHDVYNLARLTENPDVLDIACWLIQVDHLCQLPGTGPHFTTHVTPREWWHLGVNGVQRERRQVYLNALWAFEPYLPAGSRTHWPSLAGV
jgi:alpha-amylase